jgi:phage terminase large subunit GpA-like protein
MGVELPVSEENITERIFLGNMLQLFRKPERLSTREYAEKYVYLPNEVTANPGRMDCSLIPHMLFPMECMDDPEIKVIVAQKPAQIAWTEVVKVYKSKRMHLDPQNIITAFPRMESAKKYSREKLVPMIKNNPYLLDAIGNPDRCSFKFFKYPGGWLSLITARSTEELKSSSAPIIIVEEPDGLQDDIGNQGDALDLLIQRQKTYPERKLIYGGTPTDEAFSRVARAYKQSNQMVFLVPCRHCGELQEFNFDQLKCDEYPNRRIDEVFGKRNPHSAYYECIFCAAIWDDADRRKSVIEALNFNSLGWMALRPEEKEIWGFAFSELMSGFSASTHTELMKKKVKAELALEKGEEGLMKSFTNNSMGKAYSSKTTGLAEEELIRRRLNYEEWKATIGVGRITCGVDVQHNRFAVVFRGWGRNNCSWLVGWTEIWGNVRDPADPVWEELTKLVTTPVPYALATESGKVPTIEVDAISIDSSDGGTSELVYSWVLSMNEAGWHVMAVKGSSDTNFNAEIYEEPGGADEREGKALRSTIASRMGVSLFVFGAHKAHEEILRRLTLQGLRDRYYHCDTNYGGYEKQMLSCTKRATGGNKVVAFDLKPGQRKEAMDCEKMALHASYAMGYRFIKDSDWDFIEENLQKGIHVIHTDTRYF